MSEHINTLGAEAMEGISSVSDRERGGTPGLQSCLTTEEPRVVHTCLRTEADDIDVLDIHVSAEDELSLTAKHTFKPLPPKGMKIALNPVPKVTFDNQLVGRPPGGTSALRTRVPTSRPVREKARKSAKNTGTRAVRETSLSVSSSNKSYSSPIADQYLNSSSEEYFRHHPVQNKRKKRILQIPRGKHVRPLMSLSAPGWGFQQYPSANVRQVPLPPMYPWGPQPVAFSAPTSAPGAYQGMPPTQHPSRYQPPAGVATYNEGTYPTKVQYPMAVQPTHVDQQPVVGQRHVVPQPTSGNQPQDYQPFTGDQPYAGKFPESQPLTQPDYYETQANVPDDNYWDGVAFEEDPQVEGDYQAEFTPHVEVVHQQPMPQPVPQAKTQAKTQAKPKPKKPTYIPMDSVAPSPDPRRGSGVRCQPEAIRLPLPKFGAGVTPVTSPIPSVALQAPVQEAPQRPLLSLHSGFTPPRPKPAAWGNFSPSVRAESSPEKEKDEEEIPSGEEEEDYSQDTENPTRAWDDLVTVIGRTYNIGDRSPAKATRRVIDPMEEISGPTARSRLPLFQSISDALEYTQKEVTSSVLSKGKDPAPMPKGRFPKFDKARKAHPPSGRPTFLRHAPLDSAFTRMGKSSNAVKEIAKLSVPVEVVRTMEDHLRVATSSLSSGLWAIATAEKLLSEVCLMAPTNSGLQDAADLVAASRRWLSTTTDRLVVGLSSTMLMRRDKVLEFADPLIPAQSLDQLRAASFLSPSLFGEVAEPVLSELTQAREANKPTVAIKEMVSLTRAINRGKTTKPAQPGQKRVFSQGKPGGIQPVRAQVKPASAASTPPTVGPVKKQRFRGPKKGKGRGGKQA
jgi:hypothetical protein